MKPNTDDGIRQRILTESVHLFAKKGFHGTTMRDIAGAADCSLPMMYYYYKNKEELYSELAYHELLALIERMNATVKRGETLQETYFNAIKQRKELCPYDKEVYKLSLMVWLGFDGDSKVRSDLIEWENGRLERTKKIISAYCSDQQLLSAFSMVLVRVMENMVEKIILLDEDIPDEEIKEEIDFVMKALNI